MVCPAVRPIAVLLLTWFVAASEPRAGALRTQAGRQAAGQPIVGVTEDADFGWSVSVSGNIAVVGAPLDDERGRASGAAYVFVRRGPRGSTWQQEAKLTASDGSAGDQFGRDVSLSGNTIVVGAAGDDAHGEFTGAAYVFERSRSRAVTWQEVAKLTADSPAANDFFGESVSIDEDTIVVGAQEIDIPRSRTGSAYVFARDAGPSKWGRVAVLKPDDGVAGDAFGFSVDVNDGIAVIGAPRASIPPESPESLLEAGAAYIFVADPDGRSTTWRQAEKLTITNAQTGDVFGWSVGHDGDVVIVGAPGVDEPGGSTGAAYVSSRDARGVWSPLEKLAHGAPPAAAGAEFGASVDIRGNAAVVGGAVAGGDDFGRSAFVFHRNTASFRGWQRTLWVTSPRRAGDDRFGHAVAVDGNVALFGAPDAVRARIPSGLAYAAPASQQDRRGGRTPTRVRITLRPE